MSFIDTHDHDEDLRVSSIEFEQSRRDRFDITDTDDDGVVDEQEYMFEWEDRMDAQLEKDRQGRVKQAYVRFDAMDRDDDKEMSWDEYAASGDRVFTAWDTNDDQVIDADDPPRKYNHTSKSDDELTEDERQKRRDRQIAAARSMLKMPSTHDREGMMTRYDRNGDGRIERSEFDGKRRADYDATDFNNDGTLVADEYVGEFEDRMDTTIESFRVDSIRQSKRRFEALDDSGDGVMTFAEYQDSGHGIFARYDVTGDGYIGDDDPMPLPRDETQGQQVAKATD